MSDRHPRKICSVLALAVLWLLEPFYPIRFVRIITHRLGHLAGDLDCYLRKQELAPRRERTIFFAFANEAVANQALLDLWKSKVRFAPDWFTSLYPTLSKTRFVEHHDPLGNEYQAFNIIRGKLANQPFPKPYQGKFVAFHARDSAYLKQAQPGRDFSYHDFRDASIANMLPAAEEITRRGFKTVRMGSVVGEKLETDNPNIIDYPKCHNPHMDLWLAAGCQFYVGTNNGVAQLPLLFDRPLAYTNSAPLWMLNWGRNSLFIPKLYRERGGDRYLTFAELEKLGCFDFTRRTGLNLQWYVDRDLVPVENTPEDIADLCLDMFDHIAVHERCRIRTQAQHEYTERFFKAQAERHYGPNIGPRFIAKYRHLMG